MFHVGVFCFATHCELKWGSILYLHFSDKHFPSDKLKQYLNFRNEFHFRWEATCSVRFHVWPKLLLSYRVRARARAIIAVGVWFRETVMILWNLRCHQWVLCVQLLENIAAPRVIHVTSTCWKWPSEALAGTFPSWVSMGRGKGRGGGGRVPVCWRYHLQRHFNLLVFWGAIFYSL